MTGPVGNICFCFIKYIFYVKLLWKRLPASLIQVNSIYNKQFMSTIWGKGAPNSTLMCPLNLSAKLHGQFVGWFNNFNSHCELLTHRYLIWSLIVVDYINNIWCCCCFFFFFIPNIRFSPLLGNWMEKEIIFLYDSSYDSILYSIE